MPPNRLAELLRAPRTPRARLLTLAGGALIALLIVLAVLWGWGAFGRRDPLLDSPRLALEGLQAKSLYYSGKARSWLLSLRPDLLSAEDRDADSAKSRALPQAVLVPKLFRQLDRQYRFDALLLMGDPSEYRPLLDHLVATGDFTLRYVDNTSMVFRRDGGRVWELGDFAAVRAHFAKARAKDQAEVLAQTALKLMAMKKVDAAKALLDDAEKLSSREPHVANALATYYLEKGKWREASEQVDRALSSDSDFLPALATKTQLLYGTRQFSEAYELSKQLVERMPDDPNLLFYHAKIAHEAHAYQTEVATLGKLIAQADSLGLPTGGYRLYLGQAYASMGEAEKAVDAFMLALNDPDLPADQRAFARENIARIKQRTGM
jgi:tetratricopeptide (TPR) repeat protein